MSWFLMERKAGTEIRQDKVVGGVEIITVALDILAKISKLTDWRGLKCTSKGRCCSV